MDNKIQLIEDRLQDLLTLIPVFKGESAIWLVNEIIKLEVKRTKFVHENTFLSQATNTMASIRNIQQLRTHRIVNHRAYWAPG